MLWRTVCVRPSATIAETIGTIDRSSLQIALVVDEGDRLLGTVTDGDVRRGIVKGLPLHDPVQRIMNTNPTTASPGEDKNTILAVMRSRQFRHMPLVDDGGHLVGLEVLDELTAPRMRDNIVVLMAGGLGSRLSPLTDGCPKPMLTVGNKPILETIILHFIGHGFNRFYLAVNHRADVIVDHFGDGTKWGCEIRYLHEPQRLGTAGALALLPVIPASPLFVMNADVLTKINLLHLLDFHQEKKATATMCVREYETQIPYGVVRVNDQEIVSIEEKPTHKFLINAGVYVLSPEALAHVQRGVVFDMTTLFQEIIDNGMKTSVFPVREYWLDVGRQVDFERANGDFTKIFAASAGD